MSPSHDLSHVLVALPNEWTIHLPIKLATGTQIIETTVLIDCGATRNFIDISLLSKANFPLQCLSKPIRAYNVDRTANVKRTIKWKAHTDILFSHSRESTNLMVLSLGWQQVILGMPWLHKWNPKINWVSNSISIPKLPTSPPLDYVPQQYLLQWWGLDMDQKISTRPLFPPRLPKPLNWLNLSYLSGATTSQMFSLRRLMTNSLLTTPIITPSNFIWTLSQRSPRSTLSIQQKWKLAKPLSKNTLHQENGEEKLFPDSNDKLMSEKCQITSLWQHL